MFGGGLGLAMKTIMRILWPILMAVMMMSRVRWMRCPKVVLELDPKHKELDFLKPFENRNS